MSFLRRYALWIVIAVVACAAGALGIDALQPAQYTAAATIDVEARVITGTTPVTPNLANEGTVATSQRVLAAVVPFRGMYVQALKKHLSTTNPANTTILSLSCSMPTPAAAATCANAVAAAYVADRNETSYSKAIQARDPYKVTLLDHAVPPTSKSKKREIELLGLGVILGLALGVGTAYLRDRIDDGVRNREQLADLLGAPVLAEIPALSRRSVRPGDVINRAPRSPAAEAYRQLRARLGPLIASTGSRGKILLVSGARAGEGRSTVARNLAAAMAYASGSVLLVDADFRHHSLSNGFDGVPGLTDLLAERAKLDEVTISPAGEPGLRFMPVGTVMERPGDLLDPERLQRAFARMTVVANVVIVDTSPIGELAAPLAMLPVADVVMLVADARRGKRAAVAAAGAEIGTFGPARVAGVLNRVPRPWWRNPAPPQAARGKQPPARSAEPARAAVAVPVLPAVSAARLAAASIFGRSARPRAGQAPGDSGRPSANGRGNAPPGQAAPPAAGAEPVKAGADLVAASESGATGGKKTGAAGADQAAAGAPPVTGGPGPLAAGPGVAAGTSARAAAVPPPRVSPSGSGTGRWGLGRVWPHKAPASEAPPAPNRAGQAASAAEPAAAPGAARASAPPAAQPPREHAGEPGAVKGQAAGEDSKTAPAGHLTSARKTGNAPGKVPGPAGKIPSPAQKPARPPSDDAKKDGAEPTVVRRRRRVAGGSFRRGDRS